ncbi:MAG TPA: hypothetical protein PKL16_10035 [Anaerolineae bacterium]|nr:MAG: hypothetical protein BWY25_02850 [Chloroflexi bacterium ADurb.Bin222]HOC21827.1 hypothetical protein [Anaerolineae bacterium]HQM14732.1 hypothetical protein [Anaerolineae bacterium]
MTVERLKQLSEFLAQHRGLPVLLGVALVVLNFILQVLPPWAAIRWLADVDLFLHLGVILGLLGILIGDALG